MKPRAMKKKMMRGGGAVKQSVAKALPSPSPTKRGNIDVFNSRTKLNKKAQTARAAGPAVNAATAKKRADSAAALKNKRANAAVALNSKRANAAAALKSKRDKAAAALKLRRTKALKPIAKKPSKPAPTRSGPIATTKMGDEPRMYSKAIASAIKGSLGAASGSAKMMRGGLKKPVAKMRGGGLKKK